MTPMSNNEFFAKVNRLRYRYLAGRIGQGSFYRRLAALHYLRAKSHGAIVHH